MENDIYNEITAFISQIFVDKGVDIQPDENGWKLDITIEEDYLTLQAGITPMIYHIVIRHAYATAIEDVTADNYVEILSPKIHEMIQKIPIL
jgi:hypothetical protein